MNIQRLHPWNVTPKEAVKIQSELASQVSTQSTGMPVASVAGADISYDRSSDTLFVAVLVYEFPSMKILEKLSAVKKSSFPYVPGLLSFREIPPLIDCFARLRIIPDLLLCDAQGIAHPRRFGLASHLGLLTGIPSIGCAKSRLIGEELPPGEGKGCWASLRDRGEEIGRIVRTRDRVKPVYVSVGHMIDIDTAVKLVLDCCHGYRLPEPTRLAHLEVNTLRREYLDIA
ncbi:deoxyribonuclease V [candidate division KSB1 bacterium]